MEAVKTILAGLACASMLLAQHGPVSPNRYPPPGIPGLGKKGKKTTADDAKTNPHIKGVVRRVSADALEMEADDTRFLSIGLTKTTTKPDGLKPGDRVDVEVTQDDEGRYTAVSIQPAEKPKEVEKPKDPKEKGKPAPYLHDIKTADRTRSSGRRLEGGGHAVC